jgi:nucleoporin POM152
MCAIFAVHAIADFMLMFRIPIPLGAGLAVLWTGLFGAFETAVDEHNVNPNSIMFNDSLILGRQIIHILPEGSAILNPERESFCLDETRVEARLPITINATNPIAIDILRVDLNTQANETLHISKSQLKSMHKEAARLLSYSENPNEPKTLYFPVKKPGVYLLEKVVDETNLEVSRKSFAHTVVVPCPKAIVKPTDANRCKGDLSDIEMVVTGTPPMKVKYRKVVNTVTQEATFENVQPEDLVSPLMRQAQGVLVVPNRVDTEWAKSHSVTVPLSEGMNSAGRWVYAIDEVVDGFGNVVSYSNSDQEHRPASAQLHQVVQVHERPYVQLQGCSSQQPLKVAKGRPANFPLRFSSTGKGELNNVVYQIGYKFSPQSSMVATGEHGTAPQTRNLEVKNTKILPQIQEPGLYELTSVATEFCKGDILEPASCLLENPPEPKLTLESKDIYDQCAGRPIGLTVDLDLGGTPPFEIKYRSRFGAHYEEHIHRLSTHRGQLELKPPRAGEYKYEFYEVSDAVYKRQPLAIKPLEQDVKPLASAKIASKEKRTTCIDQQTSFEVALTGEPPFELDYELVHSGKRKKLSKKNITTNSVILDTQSLSDGGEYILGLISVSDLMGCKEPLQEEAKFTVRHQKPQVGFGHIDGSRNVQTLEGKQLNLPLRLVGEGPWNVKYLDRDGKEQTLRATTPNDKIVVDRDGTYKLTGLSDNFCPGIVDENANEFSVSWIARPELRIAPDEVKSQKGNTFVKADVCEGEEAAIEVLFKGAPPFQMAYVQSVKPEHGVATPKNKELRAALGVASLRMDTSQAGTYEYKFTHLKDANYEHSAKHFTPITVQHKVNSRPSAAFTTPGKTYSFCSVESDGEEVIPVKLSGQPPFELEVEIKHHGTIKPELVSYNNIASLTHNIRIPHSRLQLGKSAVSLRRISDARGCTRSLDSTTPRVQISVHDAPTITPLEAQTNYCVGDRINFALSGVAPFQVFYTFEGVARKATVSNGNTFRRLAEKPGTFIITGLQDSASSCKATTNITKQINGMPSVRVSRGKDSYVDIHEGGQAEILFDFGGTPPFEFTYTRSSNTDKNGKKGVVLDMRSETSHEHSMRIWANQEGTYEVVSIKDAYCSYARPGVHVETDKIKRLQY